MLFWLDLQHHSSAFFFSLHYHPFIRSGHEEGDLDDLPRSVVPMA